VFAKHFNDFRSSDFQHLALLAVLVIPAMATLLACHVHDMAKSITIVF
jgi:hypothetical protein